MSAHSKWGFPGKYSSRSDWYLINLCSVTGNGTFFMRMHENTDTDTHAHDKPEDKCIAGLRAAGGCGVCEIQGIKETPVETPIRNPLKQK